MNESATITVQVQGKFFSMKWWQMVGLGSCVEVRQLYFEISNIDRKRIFSYSKALKMGLTPVLMQSSKQIQTNYTLIYLLISIF